MPVSYAKSWTRIKDEYEAATEEKKPSEKFLGLFNKPSGLEKLFTTFDVALKKPDLDAAKATYAQIESAADAYQKILFKAAASEKNKDLQAFTKVMSVKLMELVEAADMEWKTAAKIPEITTLQDFNKLMKTAAGEVAEDYAKRAYQTESIEFLKAMTRKDYSPKTFLKTNEINLSAELLSQFKEDDLKNGPWKDATIEVLKLFRTNVVAGANKELKK